MAGKNYYKILNLSESASKKEVKKSYRKLAKKFHPDINNSKNAQERFIEIQDAYEKLMHPEKPKRQQVRKSNSKFEKYRAQANKLFKERQKKKADEIEAFYQSLRKGWRRKFVYLNLSLGIVFSFFLIIDNNLDGLKKKTRITEIGGAVYQSWKGHLVQSVKTEDQQIIYLADYDDINTLNKYPEVILIESPIFHYPIEVEHNIKTKSHLIPVHFTFMWGLKLVVCIFISPFLILLFRKNNAWFVFFHYSTLLISSGLILYFAFIENNLFSIFYYLFS